MLPPVQASSRSAVAFTEGTTETATTPNTPGTTGQDAPARADQNNSSSIAGRINNLLLNSRETVRADMATIADMAGAAIGITRKPGEADGALAARFVAALAKLDDGQRAALQKQLGQVLKGLQVQVLLQVLQNQDGPEAALLSAYMEIQRSNRDNLKAQTVVSSYNQNAESEPLGQEAANAAQSTAPQKTTALQTSITTALQASIAGAKDKEAVIANLAAALRQASSGETTDYKTEAGQVSSVPTSTSTGLGSKGEADAKAVVRNSTDVSTNVSASNTKTLTAKIADSALPPAAASAAPGADSAKSSVETSKTAIAETPQASKQPTVSSSFSNGANPPLLKADTATSGMSAALPPMEKEAKPQSSTPIVSTKDTAASPQTQSATIDDRQINKEAAIATALSMKGWTEMSALAPQIQTGIQAASDTELFRHMFFQASEPSESAETAALRALANRPEAAQNADIAKAKPVDIGAAETDNQAADNTAPRTQAVLTLAGAQVVQTPAPSQIILPLAVPVPLGNYLAMQQPLADERDISVDAIDALSDEEPRRDSSSQQRNQDQAKENESDNKEEAEENDLYTMSNDQDEASSDASDVVHDAPAQAALPAPQDEAMPADSLYWKIADLT